MINSKSYMRQHAVNGVIVSLFILTLVISPSLFNVSRQQSQVSSRETILPNPDSSREIQASSINLGNNQVESLILKFNRKLNDSELNLLERLMGVTISYEFVNFPLYVVPRVPTERLFELPSSLKTLLEGVYPNIRHPVLLTQNVASQSELTSVSQEISLENVMNFRKQLLERVGVDFLHEMDLKGGNVTIGIIDTGVNPDHQELQGKIVAMKSFVRKELGYSETIDNATDSFGSNGHGTGVASLIVGKNLGVAPAAQLVSAKVIHDSSVRGAANGSAEETTAGMLAAIDFLVTQRVDIISISLGQYLNLPNGLRDAYIDNVSKNRGIIFVVAAGNFGYHLIGGSSISTPGTSLQAITVGSASWNLVPSIFSSEGPRSDGAMKPDLLAPGEDIIHASSVGATRYAKGSGTSFATPIVAGIVAVLISGIRTYLDGTQLSPGLLKAALLNSSHSLVGNKCMYPSWKQGFGMVDAFSAWKLILDLPIDDETQIPIISLISPKDPGIPIFKFFYRNQTLSLPLTLISSLPISLRSVRALFDKKYTLNAGLDGSSTIQGKDTLFVIIKLFIPSSIPEGLHKLSITVETNDSRISPMNSWEIQVRTPRARVLVDNTHALIAQRGIGTYRAILGNTATIYGGFRELGGLLLEQGIVVDVREVNQTLDLSYLSRYDAYFLIEPATRFWHPFMDWMMPSTQFLNLKDVEISTILNYSKLGGKVVVLSRGQLVANVTNVNMLLSNWDVFLENETEISRTITITEDLRSALNVSKSWEITLPTGTLQIVNDTKVKPLIVDSASRKIVGAMHYVDEALTRPNGLVIASSAIMDNFGLESVYDSKSSNVTTKTIVTSLLLWFLGISSLKSVDTNFVIDYCEDLSIDTISKINSESIRSYLPTDPTFQVLLGIVVLSIGVSSIKLYKGRNKKDE